MPTTTSIRPGAHRVEIFNSGLEVWLYDEANLQAIVATGAPAALVAEGEDAAEAALRTLARDGTLVAYGLQQDDEVRIEVVVGPPLTAKEKKAARWLAPQKAFIRLPSGRLRIESNDSSRLTGEVPTDDGATVTVPAGDYMLTLHRIDGAAMREEGLDDRYEGAREVITLTPGEAARPKRNAPWLLPFEDGGPRRLPDATGQWSADGEEVRALAFYGDFRDTIMLNVDAAALAALAAEPGAYLRVTTDDPALAFVCTFDASWEAAASRRKPADVNVDEYGWAALGTVEGVQQPALFCRRAEASLSVPEKLQRRWIPARVARLDVEPDTRPIGSAVRPGNLAATAYFIPWTIGSAMGPNYPEARELKEPLMPGVVALLDTELARAGYAPLGDAACDVPLRGDRREFTLRCYAGPDADTYAVFGATSGGAFAAVITTLPDGSMLCTSTTGTDSTRQATRSSPAVTFRRVDARMAAMVEGQRAEVARRGGATTAGTPASLDAALHACSITLGFPAV